VPIIELVGLASKTSKFIDYVDTDLDTDLLTFLRAKKWRRCLQKMRYSKWLANLSVNIEIFFRASTRWKSVR
jgi:hypothetical protein